MTDNRQMQEPPDILIGIIIVGTMCCMGAAIYILTIDGMIVWVVIFLIISWIAGVLFRKWVEHE